MIRAFYRSVAIPEAAAPHDRALVKIFYPAAYTGTHEQKNSGVVPVDATNAPFPVVLFLSGINVGKEAYQWLAEAIVRSGIVFVAFDWAAEEMPGYISLTPGVTFANILPGAYGNGATSPAIRPIFDLLADLNNNGILAGSLDLDTIILGGHSAGATMAFQNTNPDWFPQVKGAFGYAGHTLATTLLGYEAGVILPVLSDLPVLVLGGTADDVIAASSHRYGLAAGSATAALERTFDEAVRHGWLALLDGADHFTFAYPHDTTTGRGFLEAGGDTDGDLLRRISAEIILTFINSQILQTTDPDLTPLRHNLHIAYFACR